MLLCVIVCYCALLCVIVRYCLSANLVNIEQNVAYCAFAHSRPALNCLPCCTNGNFGLFFAISHSRAAKWQFQPLYFAIFPKNSNPAPSVLPFHPPAGLNSNNHPSVLPFFQILAILTPLFCHFALQRA